MTSLRKILTDPAFWSLLLMNLLFIKYFTENPGTFKTFLWIYWLQSVVLGIFNFFTLLTMQDTDTKNSFTGFSKQNGYGCLAFFFLIHYGGFHFVYSIFLATNFNDSGIFDWKIFKYAALSILINQLIWFIQNKFKQRQKNPNPGRIFFTPYLRIIPMHLTILLPAFFHLSSVTVFLMLKTLADVLLHLVTTSWYWTKEKPVIGDIAQTDLL